MALTISLKVIPGCNSPLKRTNTDSGISKGITPNAPAKATKPEPAGKDIPKGKRVWESPLPLYPVITSGDIFLTVFNIFWYFCGFSF